MNPEEWLKTARDYHNGGGTRSLPSRRDALRRLASDLEKHEGPLLSALRADLGKSAVEAYVSEIGLVQSEISYVLRRLRSWMRPRRRPTPLALFPSAASVHPRPRGVVLIIGPWNYPCQLLLSPLVSALAAGNCVCLKPSELAPRSSRALAGLIADAFDPKLVGIFEGNAGTAAELTALPFDHIFFTGSTPVGRKVMAAAARNLTPIVLELGGKNPSIVCPDADLGLAARRIVWGKFLNAGQTCVAPDHVLIHESVAEEFIKLATAAIVQFFGPDPRLSPDYGRIVDRSHLERLLALLPGCRIVVGGRHDAADRYLAPTLVTAPPPGSALLSEEIFGPILPVLPFSDLGSALSALRARPRPLAIYVFTSSRRTADLVIGETESGGAAVNDVISQILPKELPFGGFGESGMGAYHGHAGFAAFTHYRSVLRRWTFWENRLYYPPVRVPLRTLKRFYGRLLNR